MTKAQALKELPLPSAEEALAYDLPADHWLKGVGHLQQNQEDKKYYITQMHFINGGGQVVCSCAIHPRTSKVYAAHDFKPNERWVYCERSVEYLRRVVRACKAHEKGNSSGK